MTEPEVMQAELREARGEAARYRKRTAAAERLVRLYRRELIAVYLRGVLADPNDLDKIVGVDKLVDPAGMVDYAKVDAAARWLLEQFPLLAATHGPDDVADVGGRM